jgi:hypothetical protein
MNDDSYKGIIVFLLSTLVTLFATHTNDSVMSSPISIADPMTPTAVTDVSDVAYDEEHKNAVDNNQKSTSTSLLDTSKGGICASLYKEKADSKKLLMAMAYGIKLGDHNLGNCDVEPYVSAKGKAHFVPGVPHLVEEVLRRCASRKITPVKCKNYLKPRLLTWLSENPIDDPADVAFLVLEEGRFRKVFTDAQEEKENNPLTNKETSRNKSWTHNDPFLRLYHCLIEDNVKKAFLKKDDALTRQQLDANKSTKRSPTWAELARDRFNEPTFIPESFELMDLHQDFDHAIRLEFEHMPGPITADEVKWRLADCRGKLLMVSLLRMSCACSIYVVYLSNFLLL